MGEQFGIGIDSATGEVAFPNGERVRATSTLAEFRASGWGAGAAVRAPALDWSHHDVEGGRLDGHRVLVRLSFQGDRLASLSVVVSQYPPEATDWESWSMATEVRTKENHDALLTECLGPPHRSEELPGSSGSALDRSLTWDFSWGVVSSFHDSRAGHTPILVRYGDGGRV